MTPYQAAGLTLVLCLIAFFAVVFVSVGYTQKMEREQPHPAPDHKVDVWALQGSLMRKSFQHQPGLPLIEKGTVLYAALVLEETSEMLKAMFDPLERVWTKEVTTANHQDDFAPDTELKSILLWRLAQHSKQMHDWSVDIREDLKSMQEFGVVPTRDEAKELLDGTTDIAVVNSGFSLAAGLPGQAAYEAVQTSNLSKANPDTGVIDKDPSGKWIKGVDYMVPDMDAVLDAQIMGYYDWDESGHDDSFRGPRGDQSSHSLGAPKRPLSDDDFPTYVEPKRSPVL